MEKRKVFGAGTRYWFTEDEEPYARAIITGCLEYYEDDFIAPLLTSIKWQLDNNEGYTYKQSSQFCKLAKELGYGKYIKLPATKFTKTRPSLLKRIDDLIEWPR